MKNGRNILKANSVCVYVCEFKRQAPKIRTQIGYDWIFFFFGHLML